MYNPNDHLIELKGRKYLQVIWRLVWFRKEKADWNIDTKLVEHDLEKGLAIFECKIYDEDNVQKSSGYGSESIKDFKDYFEKAETKAIGRALAVLGYGTQFASEFDESERVVDTSIKAPDKGIGSLLQLAEKQGHTREKISARIRSRYGKEPQELNNEELLEISHGLSRGTKREELTSHWIPSKI
jgi:hypothetical protein